MTMLSGGQPCPYCGGYHTFGYCAFNQPTLAGVNIVLTPPATAPVDVDVDVVIRFSLKKKCPKCESENDKLSLKFCPGDNHIHCALRCDKRDHLHITCTRCSYQFILLASDAPENDADGDE